MSEHARKRARAVLRGRDDGNIILLPDRSFVGWYRHITLVMLALAFLVSIAAAAHQAHQEPTLTGEPSADQLSADLWPLSVPETRHLLARLLFPAPSSVRLVIAWSAWRRWHQRLASFFHIRRRLKAG